MAEYGLRRPFCAFVRFLRSNPAESLRPKTSVSKAGVCFGFVPSDRGWAAAVLTRGAWDARDLLGFQPRVFIRGAWGLAFRFRRRTTALAAEAPVASTVAGKPNGRRKPTLRPCTAPRPMVRLESVALAIGEELAP